MTIHTLPGCTPAALTVSAWVDPLVEKQGFGPASGYVEVCWLGVLGPSCTWAYRRLAMPLLAHEEYELDVIDLAVSLGLGEGVGRNAPISRALARLDRFGVVQLFGTRLLVRIALAPLTEAQARRLSQTARDYHERAMVERRG